MAEDTATKVLLKELKTGRTGTIDALKEIIKANQIIINNTKSTDIAIKQASKDALKAARARTVLEKQQVTLSGDLKKNFKDIGTSLTGGLEGMMGEAFGPLGGIAASLTTGFFKRGAENKKNLESDSLQLTAQEEIVKELGADKEENKKKTEDAGGELTELSAESAEETAGGVQEVGDSLADTNALLFDIEEHLGILSANVESDEDRRERLRNSGGKVVKKKGKGKEEDGGFSLMDL